MNHHFTKSLSLLFLLKICLLSMAMYFVSCYGAPAYAGHDGDSPPQKTVKVAAYDADEIFVVKDDKNKKNGYAYEYIETIAKYAGWNLEYIIYPGFMASINAVKNGEADLAFDVSYTKERGQYLAFPDEPMGAENYYLYFLDNNKDIISGDLDTLQHKKIGVSKGTKQIAILQEWLNKNNIDAEIVEYANGTERRAALWAGKVDLNLIANRYNDKHFIAFGSIGSDNFYLVVNKQRPDILKELNDAHRLMMSINPYFITDISKRHFAYASIRKSLSLSELEWLDRHPIIKVGCLNDDPPFSYEDPSTKEIKGAAIDIMYHILEALNIHNVKLEFVMYNSQEELLAGIKNGEIDIISQYYFDYDQATQDGLMLTTNIYDAQIGILRKAGTSYDEAFTKLTFQKRRSRQGYAWNKYVDTTLIPCDTLLDCLEEVDRGEATGVIGLGSTLAIYAQSYPNLEYTPLMETVPLCFATSKANVPLISILDKGRGLINAGEIEAIMAGHQPMIPFSIHRFISTHLIASIFGVAAILSIILVVLFMTLSNRRLTVQNKLIDEQNATLKEYQRQLTKSLEDAKMADEAKTSFLFNMSHDIRTPMNAIIGFTNLLEKNIENKELSLNYIDKIQSSNKFLLSLINNVLEMARIESGKATVDESRVDVENMISEIAAVFEPQMKEKNISFTCTHQLTHRYVMLDATKTREIVLNLISNAVKYTPTGGCVSYSVIEEPSDTPDTATYRISINDTGIGMAKDFLDNIYEAFARERNTTQSGILGTGLGMHIVKKLVDLLGGTITIESEPGRGTNITILMKHRIAPEESDQIHGTEQSEINLENFSSMRILLAEDNDFNAEIAQMLLEDHGFKVEHAHDGIECIDMLGNSPAGYYDLILMDVQMPNMNGYKATVTIRGMQNQYHSHIPIIAMTANAFDEDKRNALFSGMNAHIPKPFDLDEILHTIEIVMSHKDYFIRSYEMNKFKDKYTSKGLSCGQLIFRPTLEAETIYADENLKRIVGCTNSEEFINYTKGSIKNIVPAHELDVVEAKIIDIEESKASLDQFSFNILRQDGQLRRLASIGCRAFNGEEFLCVTYIADITDLENTAD
ncbi:transporter substrate-binding domain-containing protein [Anaerovibrio sp.]|uniref:ATP-binding protein n=1 Tax=Anaerovibrio sp. TaxID=1872532 RepID=UPI0025B8665F|nr:transporter substrate-binding domain-containing protein [Anaerovibrio sp.]MBR2143655.1 transporter substrate-binding domain-containing protein [Anaerovibrio sp.]